jgi:hypothetical protein
MTVNFQNRHLNINNKGQRCPRQPKKGWLDEYYYKVHKQVTEVNAVKLLIPPAVAI